MERALWVLLAICLLAGAYHAYGWWQESRFASEMDAKYPQWQRLSNDENLLYMESSQPYTVDLRLFGLTSQPQHGWYRVAHYSSMVTPLNQEYQRFINQNMCEKGLDKSATVFWTYAANDEVKDVMDDMVDIWKAADQERLCVRMTAQTMKLRKFFYQGKDDTDNLTFSGPNKYHWDMLAMVYVTDIERIGCPAFGG